jgi:hypothetical protein
MIRECDGLKECASGPVSGLRRLSTPEAKTLRKTAGKNGNCSKIFRRERVRISLEKVRVEIARYRLTDLHVRLTSILVE